MNRFSEWRSRKKLLAVAMLTALGAVAQAREAWIDRDEADKELPPWIQYDNKLKGSPKLLP